MSKDWCAPHSTVLKGMWCHPPSPPETSLYINLEGTDCWYSITFLMLWAQTPEANHRHVPVGKTMYSVHTSWCKNVTSSQWERVRVVHHWQLVIPQPHQEKHQGQVAAIGTSWVGTSTWLVATQNLLSLWGIWQRLLFPQMSSWLLMTAYNTVQW